MTTVYAESFPDVRDDHTIKSDDDYHIINTNKYSKAKYTLEQAQAAAKTNKNCFDCVNCTHCTNCSGCTYSLFCVDCIQCVECTGCTHCIHCVQSIACTGCKLCVSSTACSDCSVSHHLKNCKLCIWCNTLTGAEYYKNNTCVLQDTSTPIVITIAIVLAVIIINLLV